jgi:hypothetical protein
VPVEAVDRLVAEPLVVADARQRDARRRHDVVDELEVLGRDRRAVGPEDVVAEGQSHRHGLGTVVGHRDAQAAVLDRGDLGREGRLEVGVEVDAVEPLEEPEVVFCRDRLAPEHLQQVADDRRLLRGTDDHAIVSRSRETDAEHRREHHHQE